MTDKPTYKMVGWDADFYNSLTEDDCIICLTERQVYLIGIIVGIIEWSTRWVGNITGMDLKGIQDELQYRISERMTCQNLTTLLTQMSSLQQQLAILSNQIEAEGGGEAMPTPETTFDEAFDTPEEIESATWSTPTCDIPDKDALYSGMRELVGYINTVNVDALQQLSQVGNVVEQAERLISGIPVIGQLPIDEVVDYAAFLVEELLEEYEATVDEELLERVTCDLFCLAVSNNCNISMRDVLDYFADKIGTDFSDLINNLAGAVQFALTGTFSGDSYFYFMCFFQLLAATITDGFFGFRPISYYSIRVQAGMNNPDNDWTLLCDDCPTFYRVKSWDFREGLGDWTLGDFGIITGQGIEGENQSGTSTAAEFKMVSNPAHRIVATVVYFDRQMTSGGGSVAFRFRPTPDTVAGTIQPTTSDCSEIGQECACSNEFSSPFYITGINQYDHFVTLVSSDPLRKLYVQRIRTLYELAYAPEDAHVVTFDTFCP